MEEPKITINMSTQREGHVFGLRPRSRVWLEANYPDRQRVATVFIGFDKGGIDFQHIDDTILAQVFKLITGLSLDELNEVGGFLIYDTILRQEIFNSRPKSLSRYYPILFAYYQLFKG